MKKNTKYTEENVTYRTFYKIGTCRGGPACTLAFQFCRIFCVSHFLQYILYLFCILVISVNLVILVIPQTGSACRGSHGIPSSRDPVKLLPQDHRRLLAAAGGGAPPLGNLGFPW